MIKLLKPLSFIPALVMMYLIFTFSAQDADTSSTLSYKVSYQVVETASRILDTGLSEWEISSLADRFHAKVRKTAHALEYFVLALCVCLPLYVYGMYGFPLMITAFLFCVVFACGDEYHQSFSAGRSPQIRDVGIDTLGILAGVLLGRIIVWAGRNTIFSGHRKRKPQPLEEMIPEPIPEMIPEEKKERREWKKEKKEEEDSLLPFPDQLSEDLSPGNFLRSLKKNIHRKY